MLPENPPLPPRTISQRGHAASWPPRPSRGSSGTPSSRVVAASVRLARPRRVIAVARPLPECASVARTRQGVEISECSVPFSPRHADIFHTTLQWGPCSKIVATRDLPEVEIATEGFVGRNIRVPFRFNRAAPSQRCIHVHPNAQNISSG